MGPDDVKLLFQSFIECERYQDEIDAPRCLADFLTRRLRGGSPCLQVSNANNIFEQTVPVEVPHPFPFAEIDGNAAAPVLPNFIVETGRNLARMARQFSNAEPDRSVVKFKNICIIKEPVEQTILVPVLRDESCSQRVSTASWKTCDKTALSGIHYVGASGELTFNEGETKKDIEIKILNSDGADDLRFTVELSCGVYDPKPMTVSLKKMKDLEPDERMVIQTLPCTLPFNVSDVKYILDGCLNARTLQAALTLLCSTSNVLDVQIALAFELSKMCIHKSCGNSMRHDTVLKILTDFFKKDDYVLAPSS